MSNFKPAEQQQQQMEIVENYFLSESSFFPHFCFIDERMLLFVFLLISTVIIPRMNLFLFKIKQEKNNSIRSDHDIYIRNLFSFWLKNDEKEGSQISVPYLLKFIFEITIDNMRNDITEARKSVQ